MINCKGYAAHSATQPLQPFSFVRRELTANDVLIDINYCGVCHSDIHQVRNDWEITRYPIVPGHEIIGKVVKIGTAVSKFKLGDVVGVGCFVGSCQHCESCIQGLEQYCTIGLLPTYNGLAADGNTVTYGGYAQQIVVAENYVLKISHRNNLAAVAPLLCAGITTYSPLKHWGVGQGSKVGVIGLGGLGHMAIKLAISFGAQVTLFTSSPHKINDAKQLGAQQVITPKSQAALQKIAGQLDLIINTSSANIDLNIYLTCLKRDGVLVLLGLPSLQEQQDQYVAIARRALIVQRRTVTGSLIGGIKETQAMLDYCAAHDIVADIELISIDNINVAYDRVMNKDVKYRFVIDMASLNL